MKSIFKILVLGVVPILALTAVADQALAADKGSQLIFYSNTAHKNFISVSNANPDAEAVTVLTQYYNDEMGLVLWYLRVITAGGNVLVDPFDHLIPGTAKKDDDGEEIPGSETNVSDVLSELPAMSFTDEDKKYHLGMNSGRFLIVVTAVGANTVDDADTTTVDEGNGEQTTVNILFPDFLASSMHAVNNIDNCGVISTDAARTTNTDLGSGLGLTRHPSDKAFDCRKAMADSTIVADATSKNVGALTRNNAEPIAFNHLTGHFTEALVGTSAGGADQTASWGGAPVIRPAVTTVNNTAMIMADYTTLNGTDVGATGLMYYPDSGAGTGVTVVGRGRLAEKSAGGQGLADITASNPRSGGDTANNFVAPSRIAAQPAAVSNRGIGGVGNEFNIDTTDDDLEQVPHGALVLPALHGGGMETHQIALLLSVADDFGDPRQGKGGDYKLIPAMTGYKVTLADNMGDVLPDPAGDEDDVFGGGGNGGTPASVSIIVNGIRVMTNANLGKCTGTMIDGAWTLSHLTDLVPAAMSGQKTFAGVGAMLDAAMNATPGSIKFVRSALTCKKDYGDGDAATGNPTEAADGVPIKNERTFKAGTLIVEQKNTSRSFVTTGQALLKFITPDATFAASWSLKSPPGHAADLSN